MDRAKIAELLKSIAQILLIAAAVLGGGVVLQRGCGCLPPLPAPPAPAPPAPAPPAPPAPDQPDPVAATVRHRTGTSGCTATILRQRDRSGRRLILTAAHCTGGVGSTAEIALRDGRRYPTVVVARDPRADITLEAVATTDTLPWAAIASDMPAAGDRIWHQGYGVDRPGNREEGTVTLPDAGRGQTAMRLSVSSGDSGSGIFRSDNGRLISVVCCTVDGRTQGASVQSIHALLATVVAPTADEWEWQPQPVPACPR